MDKMIRIQATDENIKIEWNDTFNELSIFCRGEVRIDGQDVEEFYAELTSFLEDIRERGELQNATDKYWDIRRREEQTNVEQDQESI